MKEAAESPVGSTARKRAQKIVSIMKKVGVVQDSQNLMPTQPMGMPQPQTMKEMKELPKEEMPKKKAPTIFPIPPRLKKAIDGKGGPGIPSQYQGMFSGMSLDDFSAPQKNNSPLQQSGANPLSGGINYSQPNSGGRDLSKLYSPSLDVDPNRVKVPNSQKMFSGSRLNPNFGQTTTRGGALTGGADDVVTSAPLLTTSYSSLAGTTPSSPVKNPADYFKDNSRGETVYQGSLIPSSLSRVQSQLGQSGEYNPANDPNSIYFTDPGETGTGTGEGGSEFQNLMQALGLNVADPSDPYANLPNDALRGAVQEHMGASAFAFQAMNDPKMLRELPGFENVPDAALPWGASLSGQVGALSDTLRRESGLDAMMSEYIRRLDMGNNLKNDLTDYIRGRDEYLNETQDLIDDFQEKMIDMDMANPEIAQRAKMYNNYLYTLRGRQNKRYVEFLNSSVEAYGNEMESRKSAIEMVSNDLENQIKRKTDLAVTEYNRYYTALTDMYQQASSLPELEMSRAQAQAQIMTTVASIIDDGTENLSIDDNFNEGYQDAVKWVGENILGDEGAMIPSQRNFGAVWANLAEGTGGVNAEYLSAVPYVWEKGMVKDFSNAQSTSEALSLLDEYATGIDAFLEAFGGTERDEQGNIINFSPEVYSEAQRLSSRARNAMQDAVKKSLMGESEGGVNKVETLREAIRFLTRNGWLRKTPSREDFLNRYSSQINSDLLGRLYDEYVEFIEANNGDLNAGWLFYTDGTPKSDPGIDNLDATTFLNNVINKISFSGMTEPL